MASPSDLKSSFTDIFRSITSEKTSVSPSNGALLMILKSLIDTLALGKLLNKLKSTSEKLTVASTFSLIVFNTKSLILSLNKKGVTANATTSTASTIAVHLKIFFTITILGLIQKYIKNHPKQLRDDYFFLNLKILKNFFYPEVLTN